MLVERRQHVVFGFPELASRTSVDVAKHEAPSPPLAGRCYGPLGRQEPGLVPADDDRLALFSGSLSRWSTRPAALPVTLLMSEEAS